MSAVALALGSALTYGTASALQHQAATAAGTGTDGGPLVGRLLRRPGWLVGLGLSAVAFVLHVSALHEGPLTVVQPVVVTTTVFAVLVSSALERSVPDLAEVAWCACTWAGLALVVHETRPRPPHHLPDDRAAALFLLAAVLVAGAAVLLAARLSVLTHRAAVLGIAAGVLYGSTAGLIKTATSQAAPGLGPLLEHWSTWLVAPVGIGAFLLSQQAYEAARLSASAPVLNIVDVGVAVTFGTVVLGDLPFVGPRQLAVELLGAAMVTVGIWRLVLESERLHARRPGPGGA